ncbi:MAG: hypothetical protein JO096_05430 [Alphaproteobacteria bacterium]|nr:hypothetical protein [Alphaproteobacteria bacterium]
MRCLVIDDKADTARYICSGLKEAGHTVTQAEEGVLAPSPYPKDNVILIAAGTASGAGQGVSGRPHKNETVSGSPKPTSTIDGSRMGRKR